MAALEGSGTSVARRGRLAARFGGSDLGHRGSGCRDPVHDPPGALDDLCLACYWSPVGPSASTCGDNVLRAIPDTTKRIRLKLRLEDFDCLSNVGEIGMEFDGPSGKTRQLTLPIV